MVDLCTKKSYESKKDIGSRGIINDIPIDLNQDLLTQDTLIDLPDVVDTSSDNDQETKPVSYEENYSDSSEVNSEECQDDNDIKEISSSRFDAPENVYSNDNALEVPIIDYSKDSN
ncbi:12312_t:CDS:2 [Funneliformis mosseae]|uniref:12312_t:CDS:1 n=1 Tax=Funneliformis mosseae TaxID=27381 RepID=A0A9N9B1R4_FUNMO|nr:12312_t:CDS:2 [Funneliformis mosseae]